MKFLIVAAALVALACAKHSHMGNGTMDQMMHEMFMKVDSNNDSMISLPEHQAMIMMADDDMDGYVNITEFVTHAVKKGMSVRSALFVFFSMDADEDMIFSGSEIETKFKHVDMDMDKMVSFMEFISAHSHMKHSTMMVEEAGKKLDAMVADADADKDGQMTGDEMWDTISAADTDGDKIISEMEFTTFWSKKMMMPKKKSEALFSNIVGGENKTFGKTEQKGLFTAFDYNKDGLVSGDEFVNGLLFLSARISRDMGAKLMAYIKHSFHYVDANNDTMIDEAEFTTAYMMADTNNDGNITIMEYIHHGKKEGLSVRESLWFFFLSDVNEDKVIDGSEIARSFKHMDMKMKGSLSFVAWKMAMKMKFESGMKAEAAGMKLEAMVDGADADKDGKMTGDEMWNTIRGADENGDKVLTEDEFTKFWSKKMMVSEEKSKALFMVFDDDKDGKFGQGVESKGVYLAFDYNKDGSVSKDEFVNAMLFIFAKITREMKSKKMMKTKMFSVQDTFNLVDTNTDGMISRAEYDALYTKFDDNMDGKVNISEFVMHYMKTGMSDKGSLYIFFRMDEDDSQILEKSEIDGTFDAFDANDDHMVSLAEYSAVMNRTMGDLMQAKATGMELEKLFHKADKNMDHTLNKTEMLGIFAKADTNTDGWLSEDEFVPFWMTETKEPKDRTELLFGILDEDDDGYFGNDNERVDFFDGFDHNGDDSVSEDEFENSMLFLFAKVVGDLEMARAAVDVVGYFF